MYTLKLSHSAYCVPEPEISNPKYASTEEEFEKKENKRRDFLKNKGLKEFRIISNTDKLPYKKELIKIKNRAFKMLENYQSYMYNLDTKTESFMD